jgi:hypothetical protein
MGRDSSCWEAVGSAREAFVRIADDIKVHLEKYSDPVSQPVTWTIYMIGQTRESSEPTVMFCGRDAQCRKQVRKTIKESGLLKKYQGVRVGDASLPPDFDQLVQLTGVSFDYLISPLRHPISNEEYIRGLTKSLYRNEVIFAKQSGNLFGKPIAIHLYDQERNPTSIRLATAGGILRSGTRYYYLTAGHAFEASAESFLPKLVADNDDFEFDLDDNSDLEDESDSVEMTSRGSLTPELTESACSDVGSSYVTTRSVCPPTGFTGAPHLEEGSLSQVNLNTNREHNSNTMGSNSNIDITNPLPLVDSVVVGRLLSPIDSQARPSLDYALIEIDPNFRDFSQLPLEGESDLPYIHPRGFVRSPQDTEVVSLSGSAGLLKGTMSGTATYRSLPGSQEIQELWTVRLTGNLENGDCGSWVVDAKSGDLLGHIIAGSPKSGVAYIVPAYQVLEDSKTRFGLDLQLCSPTEAATETDASEVKFRTSTVSDSQLRQNARVASPIDQKHNSRHGEVSSLTSKMKGKQHESDPMALLPMRSSFSSRRHFAIPDIISSDDVSDSEDTDIVFSPTSRFPITSIPIDPGASSLSSKSGEIAPRLIPKEIIHSRLTANEGFLEQRRRSRIAFQNSLRRSISTIEDNQPSQTAPPRIVAPQTTKDIAQETRASQSRFLNSKTVPGVFVTSSSIKEKERGRDGKKPKRYERVESYHQDGDRDNVPRAFDPDFDSYSPPEEEFAKLRVDLGEINSAYPTEETESASPTGKGKETAIVENPWSNYEWNEKDKYWWFSRINSQGKWEYTYDHYTPGPPYNFTTKPPVASNEAPFSSSSQVATETKDQLLPMPIHISRDSVRDRILQNDHFLERRRQARLESWMDFRTPIVPIEEEGRTGQIVPFKAKEIVEETRTSSSFSDGYESLFSSRMPTAYSDSSGGVSEVFSEHSKWGRDSQASQDSVFGLRMPVLGTPSSGRPLIPVNQDLVAVGLGGIGAQNVDPPISYDNSLFLGRKLRDIESDWIPEDRNQLLSAPLLTASLKSVDHPMRHDCSFYKVGGFCEGARALLTGEGAYRFVKRVSVSTNTSSRITRRHLIAHQGFHSLTLSARCIKCSNEVGWNDVEKDIMLERKCFLANDYSCLIKIGTGIYSNNGIRWRQQFLFKSHVRSSSLEEPLYACIFCVETHTTVEEHDATVFFSVTQFLRHLARHPRPLPNVTGITVLLGLQPPEVVDFDLHFTVFEPRPSTYNIVEIAQKVATRPSAHAITTHHPKNTRSNYRDPDGNPTMHFAAGARIVGITFPEKWNAQWCEGYHDGERGSFPASAIMLDLPTQEDVLLNSQSSLSAVAKWDFKPKDAKDGGWLKFLKGERITHIGYTFQDHWCWSGQTAKGKWGFFPAVFVERLHDGGNSDLGGRSAAGFGGLASKFGNMALGRYKSTKQESSPVAKST